MPKLLPLLSGFTKQGMPATSSTRCSMSVSSRRSSTEPATGKPIWRSSPVVAYLLMVSAMFSTPPVW
jgi:hypothetical protein